MSSTIAEALQYHQAGKLLLAEKKYQEVLSDDPQNADALHLLGVLYQQAGHPDQAISFIMQAIKICGDASHFHNNLGNVYAELLRFDEAISCYLLAIKLQSNFAQAHFNLGNSYKEIGRYREALSAYQEALIHDPTNSNVMKNMSLVHSSMQNYDAAAEALKEALIFQTDDYQLLNNLANINVKLGDFDQAQANFDSALMCNDKDATLRYNELLLHCMKVSIKEWATYIDKYMAKADSYPPYDYEIAVRLAMHNWVSLRSGLLKKSLDKCCDLYSKLGVAPDNNCKNMRAYEKYISAMSEVTMVQFSSDVDLPVFACLGDSHSLSYVPMGAQDVELIVGCKAWHLAQNKDKQYRTAFELAVKRLSKDSLCLLSFGEIDCRLEEGFCKHYRKSGGDLTTQVKTCVDSYVKYTSSFMKLHGVIPAYLNVPAPYLSALKLSIEEACLVQQVVEIYNEALKSAVERYKAKLIDIYTFTKSEPFSKRAYANGQKHIDAYHLKPSIELLHFLAEAFKG